MNVSVPKFNNFDEFLLWHAQFLAEQATLNAQWKAESEARQREAEKSRIELDRQIKQVNKQIGELGNTLGYFTQSLVEPEICSHFQKRGFNVSSSYENRKVKVNGQFIAEIDLTVENGDTTVLVEVKTTLKEAHVDEHIERITAVQQANVAPYAGKKLIGALAAITVPESVERYAIKAGFFVLYPVEEIVGVVNGDDFVPRVWEPIG